MTRKRIKRDPIAHTSVRRPQYAASEQTPDAPAENNTRKHGLRTGGRTITQKKQTFREIRCLLGWRFDLLVFTQRVVCSLQVIRLKHARSAR
jgi:hypothetical protein